MFATSAPYTEIETNGVTAETRSTSYARFRLGCFSSPRSHTFETLKTVVRLLFFRDVTPAGPTKNNNRPAPLLSRRRIVAYRYRKRDTFFRYASGQRAPAANVFQRRSKRARGPHASASGNLIFQTGRAKSHRVLKI